MLQRLIFHRADVREAAYNTGWLIVEKLVRLGFSVVVGFAVARYLGPENFGRLNYAMAVIAVAVAVAEGGVAAIVRREVAAEAPGLPRLLAGAWTLRLTLGAACYGLVAAWAWWGEPSAVDRDLLLVAGVLLFQPALAISDLWLQARLQARLATRAQLIALAIGALVRLAFIAGGVGLLAFAFASVLEAAIAVVLLNWFARRTGAPARDRAGWQSARELWPQSWPLLLSGMTVMLYMRIDLMMVRHLAGGSAAGAYAAAVRISELWFFLPGAVMASVLPGLLRHKASGVVPYRHALQRALDLNAGIAYVVAVPTVLLAPWLIRFAYGSAYATSVPVLMVHGWTLLWVALGVTRGQYCINEGYVRLHLATTAVGAVGNAVLNLVLIPRYGPVGAAWATLATQVAVAWGGSFCFASTREFGALQTRALLIPFRWIQYVR